MTNTKSKNIAVTAIVTLTTLLAFILVGSYAYKIGERQAGEELLHAMYTFDLTTVSDNDKRISELASEEVYLAHTISSNNRQLRVYLKFKGNPVEAKIINHEDNTIYYKIDSAEFDPNRIFAMKYKYSMGKITQLAEYELFLLPQTLEEDLK